MSDDNFQPNGLVKREVDESNNPERNLALSNDLVLTNEEIAILKQIAKERKQKALAGDNGPSAYAASTSSVTSNNVPDVASGSGVEPGASVNQLDPQNTYACDQCPKTYTKFPSLVEHKKTKHIGTVCRWPDCGQKFETEEGTHGHLRSHYTIPTTNELGKIPCPWPGCNDSFKQSAHLHRDIKFHQWKLKQEREARDN